MIPFLTMSNEDLNEIEFQVATVEKDPVKYSVHACSTERVLTSLTENGEDKKSVEDLLIMLLVAISVKMRRKDISRLKLKNYSEWANRISCQIRDS